MAVRCASATCNQEEQSSESESESESESRSLVSSLEIVHHIVNTQPYIYIYIYI